MQKNIGFTSGTQGRTRTGTACATTTSRLRVYQFHHLGFKTLYSDSGTAGTSEFPAPVSSTIGTSDCCCICAGTGIGIPSTCNELFLAIIARPKLVQKKIVAKIAVARVKKLPLPSLPNTVCDAPLPKDAPAAAPLPCCNNIRPMMASAVRM